MADLNANPLENFYDQLQTVPKLIRDLALGVAEAQRAVNHDYLVNLSEFAKVVRNLAATTPNASLTSAELLGLFEAMAPSRHQFTETTAEVRADLQMASASELTIGSEFGMKSALFAVAINASYAKRYAYNTDAAASIRTVIHAIPADPAVMERLLSRAAAAPSPDLPADPRWQAISIAFRKLFDELPAAKKPA